MKLNRAAVMAIVALALAGLLYLDWSSGNKDSGTVEAVRRPVKGLDSNVEPSAAPKASSRPVAETTKGHPLAGLELAALSETTARPLFERTRRPYVPPPPPPPPPAPVAKAAPPPPPPAAPPPPEPIRLRLVGVIASRDQTTAVVTRQGGQTVRVEIGDIVDGWEVRDIKATEIILARDGRNVSIQLFRRGN